MDIKFFVLLYRVEVMGMYQSRYQKAKCFPVPVLCDTVKEAQQFVSGDLAEVAMRVLATYETEPSRPTPTVVSVDAEGNMRTYPGGQALFGMS